MLSPHSIAQQLLGPIDWQTEISGFCKCPGEHLHTQPNGPKDCRVNIDGAPTIHCFHANCAEPVSVANLHLRQKLSSSPWQITLPGGRILRSGDILHTSGEIIPKVARSIAAADDSEELVLETLRIKAQQFKPKMLQSFRWPMEQILKDSPLQVAERDPEDQFRAWLKIWPANSTVWIGDVYSSGSPDHATHFRSVADWYQIGPVMGNFTCGSAFRPGTYSRTNDNIAAHRFLVVESDTLTRDQVGAVFAYLNRRLRYRLHCIIDTAGKSLHGWFDAPANNLLESRLKVGLQVLGCDPKVFTYSQPVRVPGAWRDGKLQRLIWLRN